MKPSANGWFTINHIGDVYTLQDIINVNSDYLVVRNDDALSLMDGGMLIHVLNNTNTGMSSEYYPKHVTEVIMP